MAVPRGWFGGFMEDAQSGVPMFLNFNPGKIHPRGDRLPNGGAVIGVVAGDELPGAGSPPKWLRSPRDWLSDDVRAARPSPTPVIAPMEFPREAGVPNAAMVAYDVPAYSPQEQQQHCVRIAWEFEKKLFGAHLFYVRGDPKGPLYERAFLETIRSIRPLAK